MRLLRAVLPVVVVALVSTSGCLEQIQQRWSGEVRPQDYLTDEDFSTWVVEVDYTAGHRPAQSVTDLLKSRIQPVVHKPGGFDVIVDDNLPTTGRTWTIEALVDYAKEHRDQKTGGDKVVTHVLFVDGRSADDQGDRRVLGVAIGWDLVVIFSDSVRSSCSLGRIPPCGTTPDRLMGAVTVHEFGHILGLVNRQAGDGSVPVPKQSDHEDPEHQGHSRNEDSVMYWAMDSSVVVSLLGGGIPTQFDRDDLADLCAAGGVCA